ncbi:EF-hand domain-containing protein [Homalodisca vitripennis]|nr:EF-hand domain-containing protein [Homalodisca vitripennis]
MRGDDCVILNILAKVSPDCLSTLLSLSQRLRTTRDCTWFGCEMRGDDCIILNISQGQSGLLVHSAESITAFANNSRLHLWKLKQQSIGQGQSALLGNRHTATAAAQSTCELIMGPVWGFTRWGDYAWHVCMSYDTGHLEKGHYLTYDEGRDGYLDLQELKRMMEKLGAPQTHLGLKAMIKEVDEDDDNRISFREGLRDFPPLTHTRHGMAETSYPPSGLPWGRLGVQGECAVGDATITSQVVVERNASVKLNSTNLKGANLDNARTFPRDTAHEYILEDSDPLHWPQFYRGRYADYVTYVDLRLDVEVRLRLPKQDVTGSIPEEAIKNVVGIDKDSLQYPPVEGRVDGSSGPAEPLQ